MPHYGGWFIAAFFGHKLDAEVLSVKKAVHVLIPVYLLVLAVFLGLASWGNRVVTVMAQTAPVKNRKCIIIDAGHGGMDGGATSCTGVLESNINLEISLRLNDLIHLLGYKTCMIRTSDTSVNTTGDTIAQKKVSDLKERVRIVNETENALLISIHQNTFPEGKYSGAQVFYAASDGSEALARALQDNLILALNPGSSRRCKKSSGVYLMEHIDCTGVLIECGFLSNPTEEAKLRSDAYQKKLCCVIAATLSGYLSGT